MLKLYLREQGKIVRYHEAWIDGDSVMEHWGAIGERGEHRAVERNKRVSKDKNIERVLKDAVTSGYVQVDEDDHVYLVIEYPMTGTVVETMLAKRHALEARLNETLGWTGVGHVDGGSIGGGTFEVACLVVDFDVAKRVVEYDLRDTEFSDYQRIYCEGMP